MRLARRLQRLEDVAREGRQRHGTAFPQRTPEEEASARLLSVATLDELVWVHELQESVQGRAGSVPERWDEYLTPEEAGRYEALSQTWHARLDEQTREPDSDAARPT